MYKYAYEDIEKAAERGNVERVKELLDQASYADYDRALVLASENGHAEIVGILLDAGADSNFNYNAPLRWAAENGHVDVVKLLLAAGANENDVLDTHIDNSRNISKHTINMAKYGDDGYKDYKKYLAQELSKNKNAPKINFEEATSKEIKNKNHQDLELLKRLKGHIYP